MPSLQSLALWFAASQLVAANAAPVVNKRRSSGPTSPESGSPDFLGPDGNRAAPDSSAVLPKSSYELVAGQDVDGETGLYLDFTSTPNPQPIRGSRGGQDSGPSKLPSHDTDRPRPTHQSLSPSVVSHLLIFLRNLPLRCHKQRHLRPSRHRLWRRR